MFSWLKRRKKKERKPIFSIVGRERASYLVASTEQPVSESSNIHARLVRAGLIEATVNPRTAAKIFIGKAEGVSYPDDFNDFQDYLDAYYYVPYVARAIDVKQFMIWQRGYSLESTDQESVKRIEAFLKELQADTVIREGTLYALIFGNMYWHIRRDEDRVRLKPLNPMKVGIKYDENKEEVISYVYTPKLGRRINFKPEEILHLKFNAEPWNLFGVSTLRRVLPTIKAILFMEEKLPWLARRRADPLLEIQIGSPDNPISEEEFNRIKTAILNRKPGEDIFHDGTVRIDEVYKSGGIGTRQNLEPILTHFRQNLIAGLGVSEPALGFGGTTTMATAEYQERILEAEVRSYQRALKRLHENYLFKLIQTERPVKLKWKPLKTEDLFNLSKKLMVEIEHGVISPKYARQRLGYPPEAGENALRDQRLVPHLERKAEDEGDA